MPEEPTTRELVELVRDSTDALDRRDLDGFLAPFAADAVWDLKAWGIGTFDGIAAIREFVEDWLGNYEDYRVEAEKILDLGRNVTFLAYREAGRPMGSNGRIERRQAQVAEWVGGKVVRITSYTDIEEARVVAERLAQERGQNSHI